MPENNQIELAPNEYIKYNDYFIQYRKNKWDQFLVKTQKSQITLVALGLYSGNSFHRFCIKVCTSVLKLTFQVSCCRLHTLLHLWAEPNCKL
ncbi:MAG: hypothetical protein EBU90_22575 [Proteobacteria bacterium]|nr:hypothetical protein [Pseudomonadota bacterium]NBP16081.1 hypothetical protein [bacterium]